MNSFNFNSDSANVKKAIIQGRLNHFHTNNEQMRHSQIFGLFQKRIDGDDALLELAKLRFAESNMGMELYGADEEYLRYLLQYRPSPSSPVTVHLPREFNILRPSDLNWLLHLSRTFADQISGFILHDSLDFPDRQKAYQQAFKTINSSLKKLPRPVYLFIEYAAGLGPDNFCKFLKSLKQLRRISACIDIGHLGIYSVTKNYNTLHPGKNICTLTPQDQVVKNVIEDIQLAVNKSPSEVMKTIEQLCNLNKPLHFHLHDCHPLSTFSPFEVSDHLSFDQKIPIPFTFNGKKELPTMFGPQGLKALVHQATKALPPEKLSFNLEIHPTGECLPLGSADSLFPHWKIKTHAEKMNHWLSVLTRNNTLLQKFIL